MPLRINYSIILNSFDSKHITYNTNNNIFYLFRNKEELVIMACLIVIIPH